MSSLQDPFDLIRTGQEMDNVVPFLAPNKVNQMIEAALAKPQLAPQRRNNYASGWKFAGMGIAACFALLMVFGGAQQEQMDQMVAIGEPIAIVSHVAQQPETTQEEHEDASNELAFGDFVMLETLESY